MIHCTFFLKNGKTQAVVLRGHANYAEIGKDIVCAGISALVHNLKLGLDIAFDNPNMKLEAGNVDLRLNDDQTERAYVLTEAFRGSVKHIAETYPDYVKVIESTEVI